jgi:hypothetical protein
VVITGADGPDLFAEPASEPHAARIRRLATAAGSAR